MTDTWRTWPFIFLIGVTSSISSRSRPSKLGDWTEILSFIPLPPPSTDHSIMVTTVHLDDESLRHIVTKNWSILGKSHYTLPVFNRRPLKAYRRPRTSRTFWFMQIARSNPLTNSLHDWPRSWSCPAQLLAQALNKSQLLSSSTHAKSLAVLLSLIWPPKLTPKSTNPSPWLSLPKPQRDDACTPSANSATSHIGGHSQMHHNIYSLLLQVQHFLQKFTFGVLHHLQDLQKAICRTDQNSIAQRFSFQFFNIRHKKQTDAVGLHFSQTDHNGTVDVMINVLDFIHLPPFTERALALRLKIEKHRIHQLHCAAPRGFNIFD